MKRVWNAIKSECAGANVEKTRFENVACELQEIVFSFTREETLNAIQKIGVIPESFGRDSTEEKLFAKTSDLVLARALSFLGFSVEVCRRRGDFADVVAESKRFGYKLAADAKSFRLSRTAKNQKDYKVTALNSWRINAVADFAVLVAPYFQYPTKESQIYRQALEANVCLASWETLFLLLANNVEESERLNLSRYWAFQSDLAARVPVAESKRSFLNESASALCEIADLSSEKWSETLAVFRAVVGKQGSDEIERLTKEIEKIKVLTREEAIEALIEKTKYRENIKTIRAYLKKIGATV
ncbi:MAG: HindIII family type II restriction endonuclease [Thermoguttaceae bacterium]|nr:HindIII family type II restriction endonuclease [Thermoguttaceae bacterium]MBQ6828195.1 HindIII family type II restriction endonuclease [Thermoguttaceae bacterium]MBQ7112382.1 HindIII family type II restriction endonuclease [Thermoguttaceae bacterium]